MTKIWVIKQTGVKCTIHIEPLNIEWCLTLWTIWLMCLIVYNFKICSKKKKKLGSTSSKHIFLISPTSRIPRSKVEREKMRKCVGKLHLLVTWSFTQSHYKTLTNNLPVNLGASSLNFTGTLFCTDFVLSLALQKHSLVAAVDVYYCRHPHISGLYER